MQVVFRPDAIEELTQAKAWYENQVLGLGQTFADEFTHKIEFIAQYPEASASIFDNFRQCILHKFPYSIIYAIDDGVIVVVSVFHHKRRPLSWLGNQ